MRQCLRPGRILQTPLKGRQKEPIHYEPTLFHIIRQTEDSNTFLFSVNFAVPPCFSAIAATERRPVPISPRLLEIKCLPFFLMFKVVPLLFQFFRSIYHNFTAFVLRCHLLFHYCHTVCKTAVFRFKCKKLS